MLCGAMPYHVMLCHTTMLCHAVWCCAMLCDAMPCHVMLCHAVPGRVAAENQTNRSEAALRQHYEERQRESEHVYELLENKIQLLQEVSGRPRWGRGQRGHTALSHVCCAGGQAGPQRGRAGHRAGQG